MKRKSQFYIDPIRFFCFLILLLSSKTGFCQQRQNPDYDKYIPEYHFNPSGDPTGLFYYAGLYYNNWGSAYSTDFVNWKYTLSVLERNRRFIALSDPKLSKHTKDSLLRTDSIYRRQTRLGGSGSIIIDWKNVSGFGKNGKPPLISFWHTGIMPLKKQVVGLAYSNDTAKSWIRYEKNPIIDIDSKEFRDPKVFWYEPTQKWILVIGWADAAKIKFYSSSNLKDWEFLSDFGPWGAVNGVWECADFFQLPVDGNPAKKKWVLSISVQPQNSQYFIGDFDGKRFVLDPSYAKVLDKPMYVPQGKILFDFEHGIDSWSAEGNAFVESPARQALYQQDGIVGQHDKFFINSFHNQNSGLGKITSPAFKVSNKYVNFLIAGNYAPKDESINLLINGRIVRTETGTNSGGFVWKGWDVSEFVGKNAKIQIIDNLTTKCIYVDDIMLGDELAYTGRQNAFWADYGADFFAVRSWNNYADNETRIIWSGWMGSWRYGGTEPVRGIQSVPRELGLKTFPDGIRLTQNPIKELQSLRINHHQISEKTIAGSWNSPEIKPSKNSYEIEVEFENQTADTFGLNLAVGGVQKTVVGYDVKNSQISIDRRHSGLDDFIGLFKEKSVGPLKISNGNLRLHIFVDNCSVEVFGNQGEISLSSKIYPDKSSVGIQFFSTNGKVKIKSCNIWELKPVDLGK